MNTSHQLRWSDIWLLTSIYFCSLRGQDRLRDAIAAADAINHAVINYEELSSALVRLKEHDLITVESNPWRVRCTLKASEIIERAAKRNSLAYRVREEVQKELEVQPWMPREPLPHPENSLLYPGLSRPEYEEEVNRYLRTMGRIGNLPNLKHDHSHIKDNGE